MEIFDPIAGFTFNPIVVTGMGVIAGLIAGMVGLGGGLILVPFLVVYGVAPNVAAATVNCFMVSTSSSGLYAYLKKKQVEVRTGFYLILGSMTGGVIGVSLVKTLIEEGKADYVITVCFAVITGMIGVYMLWDVFHGKGSGRKKKERPKESSVSLPWIVILGLVAGISSATLGVAGGIFIVPFLIYFLGVDVRSAVGTSLMCILFTTTNISVLHSYQNQNLDIILAFFLILGAGAGAQLGVFLSKKTGQKAIKAVFSLVALAGSFRLGMDSALGGMDSAGPAPANLDVPMDFLGIVEVHSIGYGLLSVFMALGVGLLWGKVFKINR